MAVLFGFLVLAAMIAIPVGLVKPKAILWKAANPTRAQALAVTMVALVATIAVWVNLLPQPGEQTATPPEVPAAYAKPVALKGIGVSHAKVMSLLDQLGFAQKSADPVGGQANVIGRAKGSISQILGAGDAVSNVSITSFVDKTPESAKAAAIHMSALIATVFPDWGEWPTWFNGALGKSGDYIVKDGRLVKVTVKPDMGMVQLFISPAE